PGRTIRIETPVADAAGVAGGFTVQGGGYLDLASSSTTFTGTATVVGSLMQLEGSAATQPAIDNRGWVILSRGVNVTQSGNLSGAGAFYKTSTAKIGRAHV